jgi:putative Holliday junction resolvase
MRILSIDYGDARVGLAITDELNITVQGLMTIQHNKNDKIVLAKLDEILKKYDISTFVVGMPLNMDGSKTERADVTEKFIHKLKCKYNKIKIESIDERLTTVQAHRTMNELNIKGKNKRKIVDTISAEYILEAYLKR